jgi:hypothetical protein
MNIIVTSIHDLSVDQVKPFFRTAEKRANYDAMFVVTGRVSYELSMYLRSIRGIRVLGGMLVRGMHWNNCRFVDYESLVFGGAAVHPLVYPRDSVMLFTDCRDVIFQDDPFPLLNGPKIHFAGEPTPMLKSRAMWKWVCRSLGPHWMWKMRHFPICCGGTFGGRREVMEEAIRTMEEVIRFSWITNRWSGLDQAALTRLAFELGDEYAWIHTNKDNDSPFLTVGGEPNIYRNLHGQFLKPNGQPYPIVHQWDRYDP